jgi:hypothetical protein
MHWVLSVHLVTRSQTGCGDQHPQLASILLKLPLAAEGTC